MRNRMCAWKQRDNRIHCNSILTCESGFARYSVLLKMPVSPVHLRESPLEKGRPTTRLALTARGGVRLWGPGRRAVALQRGRCVLENPPWAGPGRTPLELRPPTARLACWR